MGNRPWVCLVATALVALGWIPWSAAGSLPNADDTVRSAMTNIYVVRRGWHIDVGFAAVDLAPPLRSLLHAIRPDVKYALFGFGDRHYLLAGKHGAPVLLGALFPGPGTILLTELSDTPQAAFGADSVLILRLPAAQVIELQRRISGSVETPGNSLPISTPGPYVGAFYLNSTLSYSALHTCNTWAAEMLKAGGVPIRRRHIIFASSLWSSLRHLQRSDDFLQSQRGDRQERADQQARSDHQARSDQQGGLDPSWQTTVVPEF